jgi:HSP20 family protein
LVPARAQLRSVQPLADAPDGVDPDKVEASFDRGVLEVRIPKPEERKPRRISIGGATNGTGHRTIEGSTS